MTPSNPHQLLGIDPEVPFTRIELRRTYLRRLRDFPPERDPEGFRALRTAFEFLQKFANQEPERERPATGESVVVEETQLELARAAVYFSPHRPDIELAPNGSLDGGEVPSLAASSSLDETHGLNAKLFLDRGVSVDSENATSADPSSADVGINEPPALNGSSGDSPFKAGVRLPLPWLVDPPQRPGTLADVVAEILAHLIAGDVRLAEELELEWRDQECVVDYGGLHGMVALRWALARELMAVAGDLPAPVTKALAKAILADDLASGRPALEMYAFSYPKQAGDANVLLATRTSSIYNAVKGALFDPDAWQNRRLRQGPPSAPEPPSLGQLLRNTNSRGAAVSLVVSSLVGFVLIIAIVSAAYRTDDHQGYATKFLDTDLSFLRPLPPMVDFSNLCFGAGTPRFLFDPQSMGWDVLAKELAFVANHEASSDEQRKAATTLRQLVGAKRCNKMVAAMRALDEANLSSHRCAYEVGINLSYIREHVRTLCPPLKSNNRKKRPP